MTTKPITLRGDEIRALLRSEGLQVRRVVEPPRTDDTERIRSPLGWRGDRAWVREMWCEHIDNGTVFYEADNWSKEAGMEWRSPVTMPRWASRLTVEVVGVRVERVQEISDDDAAASGYEPRPIHKELSKAQAVAVASQQRGKEPATEWFSEYWNDHNPKHPWETNPWVWVVDIKRVEEGDKQ